MIYLPLIDPKMIKVLSVRQPWAHLIITGMKSIENRTWATTYRGPVYIHAGGKLHARPIHEIERQFDLKIDPNVLRTGAIIGRVDLVEIVTASKSPWFEGPFGWVLENPRAIKPVPMKGQQLLFNAPECLVKSQTERR